MAGVATGAIFGLLAEQKWNQQKNDCQSATSCNDHAAAVSDHASMNTFGAVSTVGFIAGGVLLAGGVVLLLTAPGAQPSTGLVVVPTLGPSAASLAVTGGF